MGDSFMGGKDVYYTQASFYTSLFICLEAKNNLSVGN
jgi:hypothetical protein